MDPNNSDQNRQNVTPPAPAQTTAPQSPVDQAQVPPPAPPPAETITAPVTTTEPQVTTQPEPPVQTVENTNQTTQAAAPVENTYVTDISEDLIDLLDEISENEIYIQKVAEEMKLDKDKIKAMLSSVLAKIDNEQITDEDIALILAATVADETPENNQ